MQDKLKDNNKENKDVEETLENAEKKENETPLGRKNTPKQKEKKMKKQEESDKESDEEEERRQERYILTYIRSLRMAVWWYSGTLYKLSTREV